MTEPLKRRNLLQDLDAPPPFPPEAAIAQTAERNGFASSAAALSPRDGVAGGMRRRRQPTGRVHQFNVRLRADTLDFIYAQANDRNVPVAQVIEEAMDALARSIRRV